MARKDRDVEDVVKKAVRAVRSRRRWRIALAYAALAPIEAGEVLAELVVRIDDLTDGVDLDALLEAADMPSAWNAPQVLDAAEAFDATAMAKATNADAPKSPLATLLCIIVALEDGRQRLERRSRTGR